MAITTELTLQKKRNLKRNNRNNLKQTEKKVKKKGEQSISELWDNFKEPNWKGRKREGRKEGREKVRGLKFI